MSLFKNIFNRLFKGQRSLSVEEFYKDTQKYSKNEIIRMIVHEASVMNKGQACIEANFKKELREKPKKMLIKTLIHLKLENNKKFRNRRNKVTKNVKKQLLKLHKEVNYAKG